MKTETLHMTLGENIGEILLDIAQNKIINGKPNECINVYCESLIGFNTEYIFMVLKNEAVLKTNGTEIILTTNEKDILDNKKNIIDWNNFIYKSIDNLNILRDKRLDILKNFNKYSEYIYDINSFNIRNYMLKFFDKDNIGDYGLDNIAARLIADKGFGKGTGNGEYSWNKLSQKVEDEIAAKFEYTLYYTVKYNEIMRLIYKDFIKLSDTYKFLIENNMCNRYEKYESSIESICDILNTYCKSEGYNNIMCDEDLKCIKENMYNNLYNLEYFKEFIDNGIIKKNIMDGYSAGWLSPEGVFYGEDGEVSNFIHLNIADQLYNGYLNADMNKDSKSNINLNTDYWLETHGWIKIHHDDIYSFFRDRKNDETDTRLFCPTDIQIKLICDYADKFYNGKFYTEYGGLFGRKFHTEPYSTYKVKQMDEFQLNKIFTH